MNMMALHGYVLARELNIRHLLAEVLIARSTTPACSDPDPDGTAKQLTRVRGPALGSHLFVRLFAYLCLAPPRCRLDWIRWSRSREPGPGAGEDSLDSFNQVVSTLGTPAEKSALALQVHCLSITIQGPDQVKLCSNRCQSVCCFIQGFSPMGFDLDKARCCASSRLPVNQADHM